MEDGGAQVPAQTGEGSGDRPSWRYLELVYDTSCATRVRLDGQELDGESDVSAVVARLGQEGWEMVSSAPGAGGDQVLWFKRPTERPGAGESQSAATPVALHTVTLVRAGNSWFDPAARAQLTAALQELTGESGWRVGRMVDKAPRVVAERVTEDEADRIRQVLEDLGATVEID